MRSALEWKHLHVDAAGEVQGSLWLVANASGVSHLLRLDSPATAVVDVGPLPFTAAGRLNRLPSSVSVIGNRIVSSAATDQPELWSIDPLHATAERVGTVTPGSELAAGSNTAFFSIDDPQLGSELATTDGTLARTRLLADIAWPSASTETLGSAPQSYFRFGRRAVFGASTANGVDIYVSDGTAVGTRPLLTGVVELNDAVESGDRLWLSIATAQYGSELWITDGTASGTRMLMDLDPGVESGVFAPMLALGDRVGMLSADAVGTVEFLGGPMDLPAARIALRRARRVIGYTRGIGGGECMGNRWDGSQHPLRRTDHTAPSHGVPADRVRGSFVVRRQLVDDRRCRDLRDERDTSREPARHDPPVDLALRVHRADGRRSGSPVDRDVRSAVRARPSHPSRDDDSTANERVPQRGWIVGRGRFAHRVHRCRQSRPERVVGQ